MKQNKNTHELFKAVRTWAEERGLYDKGDVKTQFMKLQEESGEFARAIIKNNQDEAIDALGDMLVVMINLAKLTGDHFQKKCEVCRGEGYYESGEECDTCAHDLKLEECLQIAYDVISNRKGKMIDGSFVKD
jgi:hypothetical protein